MTGRTAWSAVILACILFGLVVNQSSAVELEGFDDVEDDPIPQAKQTKPASKPAAAAADSPAQDAPQADSEASQAASSASAPLNSTSAGSPGIIHYLRPGKRTPQDFVPELLIVLALICYAAYIPVGRKQNAELALNWADQFVGEGGVLQRNFARCTSGSEGSNQVLIRESNSSFTFYASGRRFCTAMLGQLELCKRQDLLMNAYYVVIPRRDELTLEVHMSEGAMPPMVLFVGQKRIANDMLTQKQDLAKFTKKTEVTRDRISSWPSDRLAVLAEHSSLFYDVMTDSMIDQVFGRAAFESARKYFRFLHFSTEDEDCSAPRVLRFNFYLPPADKMEELTKLMTAVCAFIDIIGSYAQAFPPEARKRAEKKRQEIAEAAFKANKEERNQAEAERRAKKFMEEQEKLKRMTPQQRQKYEEKRKQIMQKRSMKFKMVK